MYLGEIVRQICLRLVYDGALFGGECIVEAFRVPDKFKAEYVSEILRYAIFPIFIPPKALLMHRNFLISGRNSIIDDETRYLLLQILIKSYHNPKFSQYRQFPASAHLLTIL